MDQDNQVTTTKFPQLLISGLDSQYVSYYLDGLGFDWENLLKAVDQKNQTGLIETFQPKNGLNYVLLHQLRSLYGDLKGLSALLSVIQCKNEPLSLDMLIEEVPKLLQGLHHPILWANDVQNRIDKRRMGK